ncbi:PorP/SprF family type IX secretion system membrane protein [Flavobacterium urocaniciphilum]|uniref:Type IX secretion system membrane protein, PorP/SprF family n=1 Tax=Flavobacterium urocaniciphilum TaxID=1299341 RepID=A0A1H9CPI7_9FLAO|nr:type IX secretion system membrane protein PorP/SprF [Flavobacterium urocaniciphilum]SEQ03132.1 type IX secretion system membrane protein, PorP/SprF family [Flavobacterium urocaniciphilum]
MRKNISNRKGLLGLLLTFSGLLSMAQQNPEYTQYMYNTITVNPGYTGSVGTLEANLLLRKQWVNIDGAPQTGTFGLHSPLTNKKIGLGLNIISDDLGPSSEQTLVGNFSYTLDLGIETKLAFGLKAGARMLNIDWSKGRFYDSNDVLLNNNIDNKIMPTVGTGAYLYANKWYVGLSVPSFIRYDYYDDVQESVVSDKLHYYFIGGYVFDLSDEVKFKPSVLVKAVSGAPLSTDFSANFLLQEKVTLGASYRMDDSVSALLGLQFAKDFFIGYSFDYTVTPLNKYNDGTHEVILRYQLPQKSTVIKSPRFF